MRFHLSKDLATKEVVYIWFVNITLLTSGEEGKFELHKWHSNVPSLEQPTPQELATEGKPTIPQGESESYANYQLGVKQGETKELGIPWNKMTQSRSTSLLRLQTKQREKS